MPIIVGEISDTVGVDANADATTFNNRKTTNMLFNEMINTLPDSIEGIYVAHNGDYAINALNSSSVSVAVGTDNWHWNMDDAIAIGNDVGDIIKTDILGADAE